MQPITNMPARILGLDIGGANLKAACVPSGEAASHPFALWKDPSGLPAALSELAARLPVADALAVTMTGELCDCWASKRQGVHAILDAVCAVAHDRPVSVWTNQGTFVDAETARAKMPLSPRRTGWRPRPWPDGTPHRVGHFW